MGEHVIRASLMNAPSAFGKLDATLERLARLPRKVAAIASPQITREIQRQFARGVDPYGTAWAPLRDSTLRKHGPPPLTDSGALAGRTRAMVRDGNRAGVNIVLGKAYGYFAQAGFRVGRVKVKPRRILPERGMPARWKEILIASARQAMREAARG
jgi:hypothetical protein